MSETRKLQQQIQALQEHVNAQQKANAFLREQVKLSILSGERPGGTVENALVVMGDKVCMVAELVSCQLNACLFADFA